MIENKTFQFKEVKNSIVQLSKLDSAEEISFTL